MFIKKNLRPAIMEEGAIVYLDDGTQKELAVGVDGIKSVFCDSAAPQVLIVLTETTVVKYSNIPFVVYNKRKAKDIEA